MRSFLTRFHDTSDSGFIREGHMSNLTVAILLSVHRDCCKAELSTVREACVTAALSVQQHCGLHHSTAVSHISALVIVQTYHWASCMLKRYCTACIVALGTPLPRVLALKKVSSFSIYNTSLTGPYVELIDASVTLC